MAAPQIEKMLSERIALRALREDVSMRRGCNRYQRMCECEMCESEERRIDMHARISLRADPARLPRRFRRVA